MNWLDPVSLVLLVVAVAFFGAAAEILWEFIRSSDEKVDPLTTSLAPDARAARARRMAGVYVRRPQQEEQPKTLDHAV